MVAGVSGGSNGTNNESSSSSSNTTDDAASAAMMTGLIDKTLSPDSRVHQLMFKRIGDQLALFIRGQQQSGGNGAKQQPSTAPAPTTTHTSTTAPASSILDEQTLRKHGLLDMQPELQELGERVRAVTTHNRTVHAKVYNQILANVRRQQLQSMDPPV